MAENRRGKDNRFYFSRGQMVLLGGAFTLTAAIIFVLGIFVGKGIEESKLTKREEPLIKIPVSPSTQGAAGAATAPPRDEITFDALAKSESSKVVPESTKEPKTGEKLTRVETKDAQPKAALPDERPAIKKSGRTEESSKKPEPETAEAKDQGKIWRAQVNAFPDERSAKQLVERLKNKGYNAYVSEVQTRGKPWYRVSVGKYNSRDDADKVVETLKAKENYTKAFAASK